MWGGSLGYPTNVGFAAPRSDLVIRVAAGDTVGFDGSKGRFSSFFLERWK